MKALHELSSTFRKHRWPTLTNIISDSCWSNFCFCWGTIPYHCWLTIIHQQERNQLGFHSSPGKTGNRSNKSWSRWSSAVLGASILARRGPQVGEIVWAGFQLWEFVLRISSIPSTARLAMLLGKNDKKCQRLPKCRWNALIPVSLLLLAFVKVSCGMAWPKSESGCYITNRYGDSICDMQTYLYHECTYAHNDLLWAYLK